MESALAAAVSNTSCRSQCLLPTNVKPQVEGSLDITDPSSPTQTYLLPRSTKAALGGAAAQIIDFDQLFNSITAAEKKSDQSVNPLVHAPTSAVQSITAREKSDQSVNPLVHAATSAVKRITTAREKSVGVNYQKLLSVKPWKCNICKESFSRNWYLTAHKRTHFKPKSYPCEECGMVFPRLSSLNRHKQLHSGIKPFECLTCNAAFFTRYRLIEHQRRHAGIKLHKCPVCWGTFTDSSSLRRHQRTHEGDVSHVCEVCGVGFTTPHSLTAHQKVHAHGRNEEEGGVGAEVVLDVAEPMALDIPVVSVDKLKGRDIPKSAFVIMGTKSNDGCVRYSCSQCSKLFHFAAACRQHVMHHLGSRPFHCSHCSAKFSRKADAKRHTLIHSRTRPHQCPDCEDRFTSKVKLHVHRELHKSDTEKKHACDACPLKFFTWIALRHHQQCVHDGKGAVDSFTSQKRTDVRDHDYAGIVQNPSKDENGTLTKIARKTRKIQDQEQHSSDYNSEGDKYSRTKRRRKRKHCSRKPDQGFALQAVRRCPPRQATKKLQELIAAIAELEKNCEETVEDTDSQSEGATCTSQKDKEEKSGPSLNPLVHAPTGTIQVSSVQPGLASGAAEKRKQRPSLFRLRKHQCGGHDVQQKKQKSLEKVERKYQKRPFICDLCHVSFIQRSLFHEHCNQHKGLNFLCGMCGTKFPSENRLLIHQQVHEGQSRKCQHCDLTFTSTCDLNLHVETCHGVLNRFHCSACHKPFTTALGLQEHIYTHDPSHADKKMVVVSQPPSLSCDNSYSTTVGLPATDAVNSEKVFQVLAPTSDHGTPVETSVCGLMTITYMAIHPPQDPGQHLTVCKQEPGTVQRISTSSSSDADADLENSLLGRACLQQLAEIQQTVASSGVVFRCSVCKKPLDSKMKLTEHLKTHHQCKECGLAYRYLGELDQHTRTHTGVRPYQCQHCCKTFVKKSNLNMHLRKH